jgi:hypothetical protein
VIRHRKVWIRAMRSPAVFGASFREADSKSVIPWHVGRNAIGEKKCHGSFWFRESFL